MLDHLRLRGIRRYKAQANEKDDPEMEHEEGREKPPGNGELEPSELEEHQPDDEAVGKEQNESEQHGPTRLVFRFAVRRSLGRRRLAKRNRRIRRVGAIGGDTR